MGFQAVVNDYQAPGVVGDFASTNPFSSIVAGPGALIAPPGGLNVGTFAWVGPQGQVSQSYVAGYQVGYVLRNQQALITEFLGEYTLNIPAGFMVTLINGGDLWAEFPAGAAVGDYVFADPNTGTPVANSANSAPTLGTATASAGFSGDGTLVNDSTTLTITTATHGIISPGDVVAGTDIPTGTTIVAQLTVTADSGPGLLGTYQMSAAATATVSSPEAITTESSVMLVTAIADGSLNFGDVFSGTDVVAGSSITGQANPFKGVASIITGSLSTLVVTSVQPLTDLLRVGVALPAIPALGIVAGTTITQQVSGTPGGVGSYTLSAAGTVGAGVAITTDDSLGGTGLYSITPPNQIFGAGSAPETITVAGTAQATGFKVTGTFSPPASGPNVGGQLAKISAAAV